MVRTAEALDGLAILGVARAGPLSIPTPSVAFPRFPEETPVPPGYPISIRAGPVAALGRRALVLADGTDALSLEFTVPTPEVSGRPGASEPAGAGTWFVHAPLDPSDLERLQAGRPELIVLGNARRLLAEGEPFVGALAQLRAAVGPAPVIWAPGTALPHRLALLAYLGCDLVDATAVGAPARGGTYYDVELGPFDRAAARAESMCACATCREEPKGSSLDHAIAALATEQRRVRAAIRAGRLRELVEARLTAEPLLAELLRYADRGLSDRLEERVPVVGTELRGYVLRESTRRPEVVRFRTRFLERYRPPPSKEVLLLLPCSRTKPYRNSRSHRRFAGALEGLAHLERLHVVSVTSPLGVVPRELEDTFPARHYDIPVTGQWDEEERRAVLEAVRHLRSTGRYRRVVAHLDREEYAFLASELEGAAWSLAGGSTTSHAALDALRRDVAAALEGSDPVPGGPLTSVRESLAEVAAYQFGRAAAERLFAPPARLAGRPWFQRLTDGRGTDLATWREPRGLFHLTVHGAARMFEAHPLEVEIDPKVELRGDLFDPGVLRADPAIRTGDAVLLAREGRLLAVGEAERPGPLMGKLGRGLAVTVRHRVPGVVAPPAPPTPT